MSSSTSATELESLVHALVERVRGHAQSDREQAIAEMSSLANHYDLARAAQTGAALLKLGAVQLLVPLLGESSSPLLQEGAAGTLRGMSRNHSDAQDAMRQAAGAAELLVGLLKADGSASCKEHAAGALRNLLGSPIAGLAHAHVQAVARAGAVEPLLAVLRDGSDGGKMQAASALTILAHDVESKPAIEEGLQQAGWSLAPIARR
jgi:hypothetical protein